MSLLPEFEYKRPGGIEELVDLLSNYEGEAAILAGGTDLIPRIKMGLKKPDLVIDIKDIRGLRKIKNEDLNVRIGSLATIFDIKNNPLIKERFPALHEAAVLTASENLQQRGTLGGNLFQDTRCLYYNKPKEWRDAFRPCFKTGGDICNAAKGGKKCYSVYSGDLAVALLSLGAHIFILGKKGEKEMPLENIFTGDGKDPFSLTRSDFIKEVIIPSTKKAGGYEKLRMREAIDYPVVNIALSMDAEYKGRLIVGSMGAKPFLYKFSSIEELRQIPERAYKDASPVNNMALSPLYRKQMVKVISEKLIGRF
ncbi:MAG TPA: FAD binding domain-containing protein [Desulfobacteraceae bacterium]|nr:FAD binding domain-containing protein [Desulfobacteraceae bacterium]